MGTSDERRREIMPKSIENELAEADRMHALAVKMRKQKDTASADKLMVKVVAKRQKAIRRMGRKSKRASSGVFVAPGRG